MAALFEEGKRLFAEQCAAHPTGTLFVGVDVGATNTRVAVCFEPAVAVELLYEQANSVAGVLALLGAVAGFLRHEHPSVKVGAARLAVAGPVAVDRRSATITNWNGGSVIAAKDLPAALCPEGATLFMNDLEASCFGILALSHSDALAAHFSSLWHPDVAVKLAGQHYLVMAMGTGLGVGMLLWADGKFKVVPLEVGHTLVTAQAASAPTAAEDLSFVNFLSKKVYKGAQPPEFEDVCSGRGLEWAYQWAALGQDGEVPPALTAGQIASAAASGNMVAVEAMYQHYRYLMRAAQNTCVGIQTRGVILSGDNQVRNAAFVKEHTERLRAEFLAHPKRAWLENTPVFVQTVSKNTNMVGALFTAANPMLM